MTSIVTLRVWFLMTFLLVIIYSLVTFDQVYITDVVPKAYFDEMEKMYMVSVTVCVMVTSEPSSAMLVSVYSQLKGLDNMTVEGVSRSIRQRCVKSQGLGLQEFYVSAEGETCASVVSKPISPEVIEPDHLWWPLGVRWPPTKGRANLTEITSKVDIMMGTVSVNDGIFSMLVIF